VSRRERAAWRRERLLDAALDVFVERGFGAATVRDIAQAAGVTAGLLYHYFDSKEALLATLLEERTFLPELRRRLAAPQERPAPEVLVALLREYRRVLARNAGLVSLYFSTSSTNCHVRAAMQAFVAEGQRLLADFLAARVAAGELRAHDAPLVARTLLASVAAGQQMGTDADPEALVDLLMNGLAAGCRRERPAGREAGGTGEEGGTG
jgi:AcrR family transcriptional regulator